MRPADDNPRLFEPGPYGTWLPSRPALPDPDPPDNGTPTSRAAAEAARVTTPKQRAAVLRFLEERGQLGATDEEIQLALELRSQSEGPRRGELVKAGLVRDSGQRRPTTSGRAAVVWIACAGGLT